MLKAIKNPALVKKVVDRVASHGLQATAELVRTRIATEIPSGYSCAGLVIEVGEAAHVVVRAGIELLGADETRHAVAQV